MRKLNGKNKIFIFLFALIILIIVAFLAIAINLTSRASSNLFKVSSSSVVFDSNTNLVDTSLGGTITKKVDKQYYFVNNKNENYALGNVPVIFDKTSEEITIFGDNYQIDNSGNVIKNSKITSISNTDATTFYKLSDRVYLIVSNEIYNEDKSVFASKYLILYIDKLGNASLLNDTVNLKTINPMSLYFNNYQFNIAEEKLIAGENIIDLKTINGSTNQYIKKVDETGTTLESDKLINSYNDLVSNFTQYVDNVNIALSGNNNVSSSSSLVVNDSTESGNTGNSVNNVTNITKRVSLRGSISYPTYIDVSYNIIDPYDRYQVVYLLVTGYINNVETTEKILLDKYNTTYRVSNLNIASEYTISLGYVEVKTDDLGENSLIDYIEDVINVRTSKCNIKLNIDKIAGGNVFFNLKMDESYALESGKISLYADQQYESSVNIDIKKALSKDGFSSSLPLTDGTLIELRLENTKYAEKDVNLNISKKFAY